MKPEYTGERIDRFGDEIDLVLDSRSARNKKKASMMLDEDEQAEVDYDEMMDEMRQASMTWLAEAREQLLSLATIEDASTARPGAAPTKVFCPQSW